MRRLAQLSVWVGAVLGVALVIAIATSGATSSCGLTAADDGLPVRPPPVAGPPDQPGPGSSEAARAPGRQPAAPADVAASLSLARNDVVFRKLLGSTQFQVVGSQPWLTGDGSRRLGTELDLKLDTPLSGAVRLPGVRFKLDGDSYVPLMLNAQVSGATTLTVFVDEQSRRVVSIMPPDSTLTELSVNPHFTPPGGPEGD